MSSEFHILVSQSQAGETTIMDHYGATNPAEFFAVATECFFEKSRPMQCHHPELYTVLSDYYQQDPAAHFIAQENGFAAEIHHALNGTAMRTKPPSGR